LLSLLVLLLLLLFDGDNTAVLPLPGGDDTGRAIYGAEARRTGRAITAGATDPDITTNMQHFFHHLIRPNMVVIG
jgi:hypothetical protein